MTALGRNRQVASDRFWPFAADRDGQKSAQSGHCFTASENQPMTRAMDTYFEGKIIVQCAANETEESRLPLFGAADNVRCVVSTGNRSPERSQQECGYGC